MMILNIHVFFVFAIVEQYIYKANKINVRNCDINFSDLYICCFYWIGIITENNG
jgi:hypothetical protein